MIEPGSPVPFLMVFPHRGVYPIYASLYFSLVQFRSLGNQFLYLPPKGS